MARYAADAIGDERRDTVGFTELQPVSAPSWELVGHAIAIAIALIQIWIGIGD